MQKRKIGSQGLISSHIGLGCMGMSQWYGPSNDAESVETIHRAIDLGITMFDTAEAYGPYINESLLGSAFRGRRVDVVIATKFGFPMIKPDGTTEPPNSEPKHIRQTVEQSLRRLNTGHIDLLYQHRFDPRVPIEDVVGTMSEMVQEGKVRFLGLCEVGVETIRRAHAVHPLSAVQSEYSLWERNIESEIIPTLQELGIGLVAFAPLGRGFLTGDVKPADQYGADDFRRTDPRFAQENYAHNSNALSQLRELAEEAGLTPAQLAIAWVIVKGVLPIPGTRKVERLVANAEAADVVLSGHMVDRLDRLFQVVAGQRYSETMMGFIDR